VSFERAVRMLSLFQEPSLVPIDVPPPLFEPGVLESLGSGLRDVDVDDPSTFECDLHITDEHCVVDVPLWYDYYVRMDNHPSRYVGDIVHDHRNVRAPYLLLGSTVPVTPAKNRLSSTSSSSGSSLEPSDSVSSAGDSGKSRAVQRRSYSGESGVTNSLTHRRSSHSSKAKAHMEGRFDSKVERYATKGYTPGTPLKLMRSTRAVGSHLATAYRALSVCGGYAVETGLVLAPSSKVHPGLSPLQSKAQRDLADRVADAKYGKATHYLTWTVARPLEDVDLSHWAAEASLAGSWAIPPTNVVPVIDLQTDYHPSWVGVVSKSIDARSVLPPVVPRVGWARRADRANMSAMSGLDAALDAADNPSFTVPEQRMVYKAWNVLAMRSSAVADASDEVYNDASVLLGYMSSADRLTELS